MEQRLCVELTSHYLIQILYHLITLKRTEGIEAKKKNIRILFWFIQGRTCLYICFNVYVEISPWSIHAHAHGWKLALSGSECGGHPLSFDLPRPGNYYSQPCSYLFICWHLEKWANLKSFSSSEAEKQSHSFLIKRIVHVKVTWKHINFV